MKKGITLYNIIFPIWLLWILPVTWVVVLLANFLIDFKEGSKIQDWWYTNFTNPVSYNPFSSFFAFLWVTCCITLTAVLIYFFNDRWCLKKAGLEDGQRKAVALSLAAFTAPYLFYLPTEFFF
ncbi:MAG: hypothetical protein PUB13_05425 [Lachnospiraceae bacterium]|nr:hypothetical protein [Lachnospiraceae bacterium]